MMNRGRRYSFGSSALLIVLFVFSSNGFPQQPSLSKYDSSREPVRLQADFISYDDSSKTYTAEGEVEIWQGDRKITADRVIFNSETQEADAAGNVISVQGDDILRGERMQINLDTSQGIVVHGTLFLKKQNYHLRGEEIERVGESTYRVKGGTFTTCNGDWPAWRFTGNEAIISLEEYADVWGATFQIKNLPILYSPYLSIPMKTQRESGFLFPRLGYSNMAGGQLGLSYFWAIAKNMDATFNLDFATTKGVGEGLEYRYIRQKESSGALYVNHAREWDDYRKKYSDPLDRKPDRWQVDFQHEEYFSPTFFAKTRLRGISDREYFVDYGTTYGQQAAEQVYSFLSLTKNWERFSFFGETRNTVDLRQEDKTTLQYYPLTNFMGVQQPVFSSPLFFNFNSSYGYFSRQEGTTGHRVDFQPQLSLPMRWGGVEFNTALGARETWYGRTDGNDGSQSIALWNFQTSIAGDLSRVYDTGSKSVPKLKHVIRPEISYTYIPDVDQSGIPYYDRAVAKTNAIFYGFTSRLIGKVVEGARTRYHEYVYLKIGENYDLNGASPSVDPSSGPQKPLGPITGELRIRGLKYITLENITNYDPNKNEFQTSYTSAGVRDSRGDWLSLEHIWRKGVEEQLSGSFRIKIFPFLDVYFGKRLSLFDNQTLTTNYGILYRHQCWSIDVSYIETPAIAGAPAQNKIWFLFTLAGVAKVGGQ